MREVTFVRMPGIGPGLIPPVTGSVTDLIMAIPYLVHDQIPPRRVLNDVLTRGISDAGMSGGTIWEPFQIDEHEYDDLVAELQRRGTRPVQGRDPGGHAFKVPDVPDAVQTYGDWNVWRHNTPEPQRQSILESTWQPPDGRRERWLETLPVGDLYLAQISVPGTGWRPRPDAPLDLPPMFLDLLRQLKRCHDDWLGHRREDIPRLMEERQRVDRAINEYVDRTELPRWPFGSERPPNPA